MDKPNKDNTTDYLNADIRALRNAIDVIDEKILALINERLLLAGQIGLIKKRCSRQIVDNRREKEIINRLLDLNKGALGDDFLCKIFTAIIAASRDTQRSR